MTYFILLLCPLGRSVTGLLLGWHYLVSLVLMLGGFLALLFLCWLHRSVIGLLLGWQFLSPNFPIDYHLSNLYQTFNFTVQTRAAVSLASRLVLTNFYFLLLLHSFKSVQQFFAFQLSRELCFFLWGFSHSCVACGGFLSPLAINWRWWGNSHTTAIWWTRSHPRVA